MSALITLTTDFGHSDWFVASMKAVLLRGSPEATIVDITHETPPADVAHASFVLSQCIDRFHGTAVHIAVVDPGVGSDRTPIAVRTPLGGWLVGPDNGIFTGAVKSMGGDLRNNPKESYCSVISSPVPENFVAYIIEPPNWKSASVSRTFHGRDVFAFVASRLSRGWSPDRSWQILQTMKVLNMPPPLKKSKTIVGVVQHVDRFGNLITDVSYDALGNRWVLQVDDGTFAEAESYQQCGRLSWLRASHGFAEIASANGSAAGLTRKKRGDVVTFLLQDSRK